MTKFNRNANGNYRDDTSFYTLFHGAKAILLEDEMNELQWNQIERLASMTKGQYTNGIMTDFTIKEANVDDIFYIDATSPFSAVVDGYDLKVGHNTIANQPTSIESKDNRLIFRLPHNNTGFDFVFLEAWFEVMQNGEKIRKYGGIDTPEIPFVMEDPRLERETSRRVQFRWRIRSVRNQSDLTSITAQNYNGTETQTTFSHKDDIYVADIGVQKISSPDIHINGNIKSLGKIYAIPLFKVNRNGFKVELNSIEHVMPMSVLRLLREYDMSKIAHATNYMKLLKVSSRGKSSTIGNRGVWIDGRLIYSGGKSYNLVVIRKLDGVVVYSETYDISNNTIVNGEKLGITKAGELANKISEYNEDYIIVLFTYDEPKENRLQSELIQQIRRCGGGSLFENGDFKSGGSYLFIGSPGLGKDKAVESYVGEIDNDTAAYSYITTFIIDGDVLSGTGNTSGGSASVNKQTSLSIMSDIEVTADILRGMGGSGVYATRQYGSETPFKEQTKVFSVTYNTLGEHNHPNFRGMPGLPELAIVINGYYMKTRHNDYKMFVPKYKYSSASDKSEYLYREEVLPPLVPTNIKNASLQTQYDYMKNVHTRNPQDCEWNLVYMEVWWEKLQQTITDYNDSFRHQINNTNAFELLADNAYWNISGLKDKNEDNAFFPISTIDFDESGKPIYLNLRYRINTMVVGTLEDIPFNHDKAVNGITDNTNRFTIVKDLQTMKRYNYSSWDALAQSSRVRFQCVDLPKLMEKCPGIDGIGAPPIYESPNRNGNEYDVDTFDGKNRLNAVYYSHNYSSTINNNSERSTGERSFNDPNLFVAKTAWEENVHHGYSFALPLEMILRTPRESWNPYNVNLATHNTLIAENNNNKGKNINNPYSGYHPDAYNFTIPADMYNEINNVADTINNAFILDGNGVSRKFMASGIKIYDYDKQRMRFPIYSEFHDFTKGSIEVSLLKDKFKEVLLKLYNGTITEQEIQDLW